MIFHSNPPLGLYIHLPWCEHKCPYCDFNSYAATEFDEAAYIAALIEDLQLDLPKIWGRGIDSIFIGGGTPSLFSAPSIERLISELRACLNFSPAVEFTLEANPGSAEAARFEAYLKAGINRLSIGVQSFNNDCLAALGRIHNRDQALAAVDLARQAGCTNINLDLMYGLPGQTIDQALDDLHQALALTPEHLSHYQLTIEPNTLFHHQPPPRLPDDEATWMMQQECQRALRAAGYRHYEISAYSRNQRQSQHNLNYWTFGDYLGIGAGAHSKITLAAEGKVLRQVRLKQPQAYLQAEGSQRIARSDHVDASELAFEFMLNALRLVEGFDLELFEHHTGLQRSILGQALAQAEAKKLLTVVHQQVRPTELGLRFHNDLQAIFLDLEIEAANTVEPFVRFE